ncbi:hypothetical protein [Lactobacillus kitasatonis]|uniref:hypothetical protein n=1 Tax=Lactobacillus kitasatonis TaxID=237446 RepID=UPI003F67DC63
MKIDIAYSQERQRLMTAIEANELWQNGELNDKHAFTCPGKDCSAPITCENMNKFEIDQKRVPHFVWGHRSVKHSKSCDYDTVINEWRQLQQENPSETYSDKKDQNEVIFDCNNIEDLSTVKHTTVKTNLKSKNNDKGNKSATNNLKDHTRVVRPHYQLLPSLVNLFLDAEKENDLENKRVKVNFDTKSYTYRLNTLFTKISNYDLDNSKSKTKVFYGDANISEDDEKYYIKFEDKFENCDAEVRCTIKKKDIVKVRNANAKLRNFDNYLYTKNPVQVFVLGEPYKFKSKENKKKTIIYINPYKGLFDLVAVKK